MWEPVISTTRFNSRVNTVDDFQATGKWLVPIPFDDPDDLWEKLEAAARTGELLAIKISSHYLDSLLKHHLVCVYCVASTEASVAATLSHLRELGVAGELQYKSDRATHQRRDEYLWSSSDVEARMTAVAILPAL